MVETVNCIAQENRGPLGLSRRHAECTEMEPTTGRMRVPFVWMLPALWAACSLLQHRFPGRVWFLRRLRDPGIWSLPFVFRSVSIHNAAPYVALAGAPLVAAVGLAMDRVRVRKALWMVLWGATAVAAFCVVLMSFPSMDRAIRKNGSLLAYVLLAATIGLYGASVFSLVFTLGWRIVND